MNTLIALYVVGAVAILVLSGLYIAARKGQSTQYHLMALYVLSVLLANLTVMNFISLPVFGLLSIGTIFFAAVFTLRDRIHGYGLKWVYSAIAVAAVVNVLAAYFTGTPTRILLASFITLICSELADTAVYQRLIQKSWLTRVMASNGVSVPLDSIMFNVLAFLGTMSHYDVLQIVWGDIVAKYIIALIFAINISIRRKNLIPA